MRRIDVSFILLAALCLIVGVCLGIFMGIKHDFQFAPVHAHLNLLGWTSLALFGLTYRAYPELARSRMAAAHLVAAAVSAPLFPLGIFVSIAYENPGLAIAASLVWLAGALLFLANLVRVFVLAGARAPAAERALA